MTAVIVPSERCSATSKRTGKQCGQVVPGGGKCRWHGGASPNAVRARKQRIELMTLAQALAVDPRRDAGEVLADSVHALDFIARRARTEITAGSLTGETLAAIVDATERAARWAKSALDARTDERRAAIADSQVQALKAAVVRAAAAEIPDASQRDRLLTRVGDELARLLAPAAVDRRTS